VAFVCRENTLRQKSDGLFMLILRPDIEIKYFQNMKCFLTGEFIGYLAANNSIPILAFNSRHNQRGALVHKNCGKLFNI
jgi:hypothetical protein